MAFVAMLRADRVPIAARYYYACHGIAYEYLTGYDPDYGKLSPGGILTLEVADFLSRAGYREMDLMRGDEAYKFLFTRVARVSMNHTIYRSRGAHAIHGLAEAVSGALRRR